MKKMVSAFFALVLLVSTFTVSAAASSPETVPPVFGGTARASSDVIHVTISLLNVADTSVHSGQIEVAYDTSKVTLSKAELGASIADADVKSLDTAESGKVQVGFANLAAVPAGPVLEIDFQPAAESYMDAQFTVSVPEYSVGEDGTEGEMISDHSDFVVTISRPSSGSGSGSGSSSSNVTTSDVNEGGQSSTVTTARPSATEQNGKSSASVSTSLGAQIVEQAVQNNSDTVVIAPKMSKNTKHAELKMPGSVLRDLGEQTNADLRIETPVANVTIRNEALSELGRDAKQVVVSAEKTDDNAVKIDITVDGESVSTVTGGLKTSFDLGEGEVAVLVAPDGTETIIRKSLVEGSMAYVLLDGPATVKIVDNTKSFDDVADGDWFNDYVGFVSSHELFKGVTDTQFAPDVTMTRSMLATVLWRLENEEAVSVSDVFSDVGSDEWFSSGVLWANEHDIVQGYGGSTFGPADSITREQLATMLCRYAKYAGVDTSAESKLDSFSDRDQVSSWAKDSLEWAISAGLVEGKPGGLLDPGASASRAEVAAVLQRMITVLVK